MKIAIKPLSAILLAVLATAASAPVLAHGVRFGFNIGIPLYPPAWYYPPPAYYAPSPVVVVPAQPPVYVERPGPQAAPGPVEQWWYYCPDARAYYPYVQQCSSTWQRVSPRPPGT